MSDIKYWVPEKEFKEDEHIFLMSATHRGDMYHLRAAMQINKYSVVLYESNAKTKQLEDYLKKSVLQNKKHIWVVPWTWNDLKSDTLKDLKGCSLDGKDVTDKATLKSRKLVTHSENKATTMISKQKTLSDISKNMAILTAASKKTLDADFEKLFKGTWNSNLPTILSLNRDTGTTGGVYPELDTGDALKEIDEIVKKIPKDGTKSLRTVTCGNKAKIGEIPSIGEYWTSITTPAGETTRDVEAYFLEWAYKKKYYQMAIGFRSGALDLFTFLGIPTVSIGLRKMVGEGRHGRLAKAAFKRLHTQYDQPRQGATAYIKPKKNNQLPSLGSPFWEFDTLTSDDFKTRNAGTDDEKKKARAAKPGNFTSFDGFVLEVGIKIASEKYLSWPQSIVSLKEGISASPTTNARTARYYHPTDLTDPQKLLKHFNDKQVMDRKDVDGRKNKRDTLQELKTLFDFFDTSSKGDWDVIYDILGDEETL